MSQSVIDGVLYRFERSKQCIASAQLLYDVRDYRDANGLYYSIFHNLNYTKKTIYISNILIILSFF